ncbi:MAG: beta-lactamase domain protein [Deltaproteobacteria bacterium]|nr:beta-lactamase domain protein [Deltaproteobacteria bacterium]
MIIKVLGAAGSEVPGHNCPAFLVDETFLLDAGTVALALNIREERTLRWILLSHAHLDHIKGIPFLLDNLVSRSTGNTVTVLGGKDVLGDLKKNIFNDRIWPDFARIPSPGQPSLRYKILGTARPYEIDGYTITMEKVDHTVPAYGYIVEDPEETAIAYTGDRSPTAWKNSRWRASTLPPPSSGKRSGRCPGPRDRSASCISSPSSSRKSSRRSGRSDTTTSGS